MIETVLLPPDRRRPSAESLDARTLQDAANTIQRAFDVLLGQDPKLAAILKSIQSRNAKMVVFGGWARDRLIEVLHGKSLNSRDIDFVVESPFPIGEFFPSDAKENLFGGIGVTGEVMPLEAWNLRDTFLLKKYEQQATFATLPATADYDVNALLFFPSQCHGEPSLLDWGAGNALKRRRLDFMADEVAQPKVQAARAVILATKLELQPSEALCDFVQDVCEEAQTAKEVQDNIGKYCPSELLLKARLLLAQIRQGNLGGRPKTELFFHCWGVFEGGGVRVAAHAGAYAAAKRAGVTFGRVAGTSGGSIVAALVAAGASPSYLRQHLQALEFLKLLGKPSKDEVIFEKKLSKWTRVLRIATWGRVEEAVDVATYGGLHDSKALGNWIEERLLDLVRPDSSTNKNPVLFSELPIPLYVVATDFSTGQPKVWSRDTAGQESVALAVRHSCTIPFFFQPVRSGSSIYLDGGAVSNLPAYVLNQSKSAGERDVLSRILAFRLVADDMGRKPVKDIFDFAHRLSAAVIDSASDIQLKLQPNVYPVRINTGAIRSTDFKLLNDETKRFLYGRGVKGAREFFERERLIAQHSNASAQEFQGFDEKMLLVVRQSHSCKKTFLAVGPDTYWLDHVFPSLLLLLRRGIAVTVVVSPASLLSPRLVEQEVRRQRLLRLVGATVTESSDRLPFIGFAFDLASDRASTILTYLPEDVRSDSRYENEKIRLYTADSDPVVVDMVAEQVASHTRAAVASPLKLPYEPCAEQKLVKRLRQVPAYHRASIAIQRVPVTRDILIMQRRIKEFKALQVRSWMTDLANDGRSFFGSLQVQLTGSSSSIVTPPVLERHSGSLVVIEGNARLHQCFSNGIDEIEAVVIEGVTDSLPSDGRYPLSDARLVSSTISMSENYENLRSSDYRHIERAVHESYE